MNAMAAIKDQAVVLRRLDYSETSQVLVFFTREHGPQRLIAKGIKRGTKKKFSTGIDLLERGQVMFLPSGRAEGSLGTLTEWRQSDLFMGLRGSLEALYAGQYAAEVTAAMTEEGDPHPELFDALAELLSALSAGAPGLAVLVTYQQELLTAAGLWPELTRCVLCGKAAPPGRAGLYSAHQGGLVCSACETTVPEKRKIGSAVLTALRTGDWTPEIVASGFDVFDYTITHTIGRPPALTAFVRRINSDSAKGRT
jgi:DNA repair protein RecO (recombination protein O)